MLVDEGRRTPSPFMPSNTKASAPQSFQVRQASGTERGPLSVCVVASGKKCGGDEEKCVNKRQIKKKNHQAHLLFSSTSFVYFGTRFSPAVDSAPEILPGLSCRKGRGEGGEGCAHG